MAGLNMTPVAQAIPFNNYGTTFTSNELQGAVVEAKSGAVSKIRVTAISSYNSNAGVGRWLEFADGVTSNEGPFILARNFKLSELTLTSSTIVTTTLTIFKDVTTTPVAIQTISLSGAKTNYLTGLSVTLIIGDEIGVQVTSGSCTKPVCILYFEATD